MAHISPDPQISRPYGPGGLLPDSRCRLWGWVPLPSPSLCGGREPQHTPRLRRRIPKTEVTAWRGARGSRQSTLQQETALPLPRAGPVPGRQLAPQNLRHRQRAGSARSSVPTWPVPPADPGSLAMLLAPGPQPLLLQCLPGPRSSQDRLLALVSFSWAPRPQSHHVRL